MKNPLLLIIFFFIVLPAIGQNDQFVFGKVDKVDLSRSASGIDKNAEAEVIFEYYDVKLSLNAGYLEISIKAHTRIKIYNEKGLDEANIKIAYDAREGHEGIYKLEGQTYNLDSSGNINVSKLEKKSIYNKKINNREWNQIFTFPEVKAGSVIEYQYTLKRNLLYFDDWTFQRNIPVRYSNCTIEYPAEFSFSHIATTTLPMETDLKQSGYTIRKSFTMKDLPALKDEPYISCREDYLQKIEFRMSGYYSPELTLNLSHTWPEIIKKLMDDEDFGVQLTKNIQNTKDLDEKLILLKTDCAKMTTIHNYVRDNMTWDGYNSIWALDGVKHAWEEKKGNSGEINLILVNLLKEAGLKAYPMLVSTRSNGKVNTLNPTLAQFNTVMAMVMIDSSYFILDATDKETPSHLIPKKVMFTEGLVINKIDMSKTFSEKDYGWVTIWNEKQKFNKLVNISAVLNSDGIIKGSAFIMNNEYARIQSLKVWKEEKEKIVANYSNTHSGLKLSEFSQKNEDHDSLPLEHQFKFELAADESGDYRYFSVNLFAGLEKNPFISDERNSDVTFGYNQKYVTRGVFTIPEGFAFEELPKDTKMVMPDKSIVMTRIMKSTGSILNFSISIEFNRPSYTIDEYPDFKEFYKQLFNILNEQIVIKKVKS